MAEQQSAHTKRFRRIAIVFFAVSGVAFVAWFVVRVFFDAGPGLVLIPVILGLTADLFWHRSDPIRDRSRYRPGGDLAIEPEPEPPFEPREHYLPASRVPLG